MKVLLTGVTGYIGKRLLPILLEEGHEVYCCVRDKNRFNIDDYSSGNINVIEVNFLDETTLQSIPDDIDAAYYLIHSMSSSTGDFDQLEKICAENFKKRLGQMQVKQVIYLSGIVNDKDLSNHLKSRKSVEDILASGSYHLTTLRAGIIVGSGSASFEIIRDLVEKLPIMVVPKWLMTKSQPIAIRNVIEYLKGVLMFEKTFDQSFDIGGPEILTYKQMLLSFAKIRKLKRFILIVPVMTPKLSSYWLYFVTSTTYKLAINLVDSMKVEVICSENQLNKWLNIKLLSFEEAVRRAFVRTEQQVVLSRWTDAQSGDTLKKGINKLIKVPTYGCLIDRKVVPVKNEEETLKKIWSIGGENGWYYANWLWKLRGFFDKLVGGVGLRRGRKSQVSVSAGESLDFWRIIYASREEKRLLLYAEMKLPGEAWLEFSINGQGLNQIATFRPKGVFGRMYWYILLPMHNIIFKGMIKRIAR